MPTAMNDFDKIINRRGSGALKTDALQERYGRADLIPLWVADMDFESPSFIREALRRELEIPVLGYAMENPRWRDAIISWQLRRHQWDIERDWLTFIPGIVKGIALAVEFLTNPGDKVLIMPPVYHPFRLVTVLNGREAAECQMLTDDNGRFMIDFDKLEEQAPGCKLLIFANPHNPGGRVWTKEELQKVAEICHRHGVTVISDEIHCDLTLPDHKHIPFATVSPEAAKISITFGSPSKAFNIPGLASSFAVVPDEELRNRFYSRLAATELNDPCLLQQAAVVAAYEKGEEWLASLIDYIVGNIHFTNEYLKRNIPEIKAVVPEASYLIWLDCRELGLNHQELNSFFIDQAHLALNDGVMFGSGSEGFMRLNVGSPRAVIEKALDSLRAAVNNLKTAKR